MVAKESSEVWMLGGDGDKGVTGTANTARPRGGIFQLGKSEQAHGGRGMPSDVTLGKVEVC